MPRQAHTAINRTINESTGCFLPELRVFFCFFWGVRAGADALACAVLRCAEPDDAAAPVCCAPSLRWILRGSLVAIRIASFTSGRREGGPYRIRLRGTQNTLWAAAQYNKVARARPLPKTFDDCGRADAPRAPRRPLCRPGAVTELL